MALAEGSVQKTINTVTETAAMQTILWRTLNEEPEGGGVFPSYPVTCKYASTTFEVDDQGRKIHILEQTDPVEFSLAPEELYPLYMFPVTITVDGAQVNTVLGELLCNQVDGIIKERKLQQIIKAHPASQECLAGGTVYLTVRINKVAVSRTNYTISWYKDGLLLPDASTEEISVQVDSTATFQAWVTTLNGIAKSDLATITVIEE